jgi:metallophosphoesterase superfamily enzyme
MRLKTNRTSVSLSDIHFGCEDEAALRLATEFIEQEKPDLVVLNGDIIDAYDASSFLKNPTKEGLITEELRKAKEFIAHLRQVLKHNAKIIYIEGNHEDRLRRNLWSSPLLAKLCPEISLNTLLDLPKFKVQHIPYGQHYTDAGVVYTHGHKVSKNVGMDNIISYGSSGTSGHTHRLNSVNKRMGSTVYTWVESGCLCDLSPSYIHGIADWHHGFTYGCETRSGNMMIRPMTISGSDVF